MKRIATVLVIVLALASCGGGSSDDASPTTAEEIGTTTSPEIAGVKAAAKIAYNTSDPSVVQMADVLAYLQGMADRCDDLTDTGAAADLYAGVLTVAERESGKRLDPHDVLDGLDEATTSGGQCKSIAAGYVAVLSS